MHVLQSDYVLTLVVIAVRTFWVPDSALLLMGFSISKVSYMSLAPASGTDRPGPRPKVQPSPSPARRAVPAVLTLVVALLLSLTAGPSYAAASGRSEFLLVADPAGQTVTTFRTSDLHRTGELDGVAVGGHVGTLQLPDGRLIAVDDAHARVLALRVTRQGRPQVVQSVPIPSTRTWERAAWGAADASLRYFAFTSDFSDSSSQLVTVVDLKTFHLSQLELPLTATSTGGYAEAQVYLAGRPLQVVVTTGGAFTAYPLRDVLRGRHPAPSSSAPLGANNHGPVVSPDGKAVFSTTADGFDGASLTGSTLTRPRSVAYSPTRDVVQNYRPKLAADGRTVWGAVAEDTGLAPQDWADTRNDVNIIDTATFRSSLVRLPDGLTSQLALSARYGAVSTTSPDGDALTLLDTDRRSATYRRVVGTVALPSATGGPVAGQPSAGTQGHTVAIAPRGNRVFVSNGGDGEISVVDSSRRRLVATISTPTGLVGGGYLTVVQPGATRTDLIAR